ncbi:Calcium-responsive transcription factor, partial [Paramuricea clavata]
MILDALTMKRGEFFMRSSCDSDTFYALHFGQPSCQCESWRKTQYPCKHFYAIFNFFEEWNFSRLPEFYKNSVFITLDTEHLTTAPTDVTTDEQPSQSLVDSFANDRNGSNVNLDSKTKACADHSDITESDSLWKVNSLEEPPQKEEREISNPLKLRKLLLGKIDSLKNLIFLIDDANVLQNATSAVDAILANVQQHCPEQNGIPLRQSPVKKKLKKTSVDYHKVFHKKLPMRKKFSKKATNVRLIDLTDEESTTPITTEEPKTSDIGPFKDGRTCTRKLWPYSPLLYNHCNAPVNKPNTKKPNTKVISAGFRPNISGNSIKTVLPNSHNTNKASCPNLSTLENLTNNIHKDITRLAKICTRFPKPQYFRFHYLMASTLSYMIGSIRIVLFKATFTLYHRRYYDYDQDAGVYRYMNIAEYPEKKSQYIMRTTIMRKRMNFHIFHWRTFQDLSLNYPNVAFIIAWKACMFGLRISSESHIFGKRDFSWGGAKCDFVGGLYVKKVNKVTLITNGKLTARYDASRLAHYSHSVLEAPCSRLIFSTTKEASCGECYRSFGH